MQIYQDFGMSKKHLFLKIRTNLRFPSKNEAQQDKVYNGPQDILFLGS